MNFTLHPWQVYFLVLAGWVNRQQQFAIEYLRTENQVLKEKLGKKRILLNDDQRRRLAVKGKVLGRKMLGEVGTIFSPDTILRWHRQLVAKKWDYSDRKKKQVGRPRIRQVIVDLISKFKKIECAGLDFESHRTHVFVADHCWCFDIKPHFWPTRFVLVFARFSVTGHDGGVSRDSEPFGQVEPF